MGQVGQVGRVFLRKSLETIERVSAECREDVEFEWALINIARESAILITVRWVSSIEQRFLDDASPKSGDTFA